MKGTYGSRGIAREASDVATLHGKMGGKTNICK